MSVRTLSALSIRSAKRDVVSDTRRRLCGVSICGVSSCRLVASTMSTAPMRSKYAFLPVTISLRTVPRSLLPFCCANIRTLDLYCSTMAVVIWLLMRESSKKLRNHFSKGLPGTPEPLLPAISLRADALAFRVSPDGRAATRQVLLRESYAKESAPWCDISYITDPDTPFCASASILPSRPDRWQTAWTGNPDPCPVQRCGRGHLPATYRRSCRHYPHP